MDSSNTAMTARWLLREGGPPLHLPVPALRLHREVRRRLREMDLAAEHGRDPWTAHDLRCAVDGWYELLTRHLPGPGGRCPACRTRWGRAGRWPCEPWRTAHRLLRTAGTG